MATNNKVLVSSKKAEVFQTTQYTATGVTTIIDKFTVTNTTTTNVKFSVNIIAGSDTASNNNLIIKERIIPFGETYSLGEIIGQVLSPNDYISTLSGLSSALTIRICGREIR